MDPSIDQLAGQLWQNVKGSLTASANQFLDQNAEVREFIQRKVKRAAELVVEYARASEAEQPEIRKYMEIVNRTITNEAIAVLLNAEPALKDAVLSVLKSVFQFALENLPAILALLAKK